MPAVGIDHVVMSDLPQPEVKRQGRVTQVFTQPLAGSQEHVLDDVAGIDPPAQRLVQPQSDHPPEGRAVTLPEFVRGGRVGLLNLLQEPLRFQSHLATSVNPCPGLACPVRIAPRIPPWRVRPTGDPNRFVSIPAGTHGRPSFPMGIPIPDFFNNSGKPR